jgi:hypothetical protein
MATSRTSRARSRSAAQWLHNWVRVYGASGSLARANGREPGASGLGLGLLALMVLTTFVVAWVSVWWVPAYLALMVLIFVATYANHGLRDRTEQGVNHHHGPEIIADTTAGGTTAESAVLDRGSTRPGASKSRRGRGRSRKVAMVTESPAGSSSVTWIRVGPGKFVRADANTAPSVQVLQDDEVAVAHALADTSLDGSHTPLSPDSEQVLDQLSDAPEATHGARELIVSADASFAGLVTEEYGITPSAFDSVPPSSSSSEVPDVLVSGLVSEPAIEATPSLDFAVNALEDEETQKQAFWPREIGRSRIVRLSRRIQRTAPIRIWQRTRHQILRSPKPRNIISSSSRPDACRRQNACRAFGRVRPKRAPRPRSPPYR